MPTGTSYFRGGLSETRLTKSVAGGSDVVLFSEEAINRVLQFTGALTEAITVRAPLTSEDTGLAWVVENDTTGGFPVTFAGLSGDGIAVEPGGRKSVAWSGTAVVSDILATGGVLDAADFGVPEDGSNAHTSLQALLDLGTAVQLSRGVTYFVDAPLVMAQGQILYGNGATLKRMAQAATTTVETITSGVTSSFIVASATNFRVGQKILIENGGTYSTNLMTISAIDTATNRITIAGVWQNNFSGTTNVYTAYHLLTAVTDCRVLDLKTDGNQANWVFSKWDHVREIDMLGDRIVVERCHSVEAPGEAIYVDAGLYPTVRANTITTCDGNPIHLSGCTHPVIVGNHIKTGNVNGAAVGHNGSGIQLSLALGYIVIDKNHIEACRAAVGPLNVDSESTCIITGNTMLDCTTFGIDATVNDEDPSRIIIEGNIINNCVENRISNTNVAPTQFPFEWIFRGNSVINTKMVIRRVKQFLIEGNLLSDVGDTTTIQLLVSNSCENIRILGNIIRGGSYGVYCEAACEEITIDENEILGQLTAGMFFDSSAGTRITTRNNTVKSIAGSAAGWVGIAIRTGHVAQNNRVEEVHGGATSTCILVSGTGQSAVQNNRCVKGTGQATIRVSVGVVDAIVGGNLVDAAITDGGTTTTVYNNTVMAA